ncbi:hypothetical protein CYMTET_30543 [Cymbomonas tetramitiformis]|uniref:Uncharacterized protein n=1 Tax=Cymbomonas tetramitiformis TaxID=36881 RepID=A0AAE0FIN7_9CHLO|nr:hypothetical protein CYMTET_30543 [Cymbomonas tetramitiformis]
MGKKRAVQRTREVTPLSDAVLLELEKGRMTRAAVAKEGAEEVKKTYLGVSRKKIEKAIKHADAHIGGYSQWAKNHLDMANPTTPAATGIRARASQRVKLYPNKSPNAVGGPGIDDTWPAAVIRDFRRAAGHGNAVKVEAATYEEALTAAEAFMASEPADETGPVAVVEARIASTNIFVRFFIVTVIGSAFSYGLFQFAVFTNDFFECRKSFNSTHVFCVFSYELLHLVTKNTQVFQSVLMAQFLTFVTIMFTKLVNLAMRMLG